MSTSTVKTAKASISEDHDCDLAPGTHSPIPQGIPDNHDGDLAPGASITDLPVELLYDAMEHLSWQDRVNISHTNSHLRSVALGKPGFWQEIKVPVRWDSISAVHDLVSRASPHRPLRVTIVDISPGDCEPLCVFLREYLSRIEFLELRFSEPDPDETDMGEWLHGIANVWVALSYLPPSQLKMLKLTANTPGRTIYQIPYNIFRKTPPPKLTWLKVEGFSFEQACRAFSSVSQVYVDIAVLHSTDRAPSLGKLFPGARHITVSGMEAFPTPTTDGNLLLLPEVHLARVPVVTAQYPLRRLHLKWNRLGHGVHDIAAADWVRASAPFCTSLWAQCPDIAEVHVRTFRSLSTHAPNVVVRSIDAAPAFSAIGLVDGNGREAFVVIQNWRVEWYVRHIAPICPAAVTFSVPANRLSALGGIATAYQGRIRNIVMVIAPGGIRQNGSFFDPSLLARLPQLEFITGVKFCTRLAKSPFNVDSSAILTFLAHIAPNVLVVKVDTAFITVVNPQPLLDRFPYCL